MLSSREKILNALLNHPQMTINDLSEEVGINGISIRHHLINLQAKGIVSAEEQRHGVGRPRLVYKLTQQGIENFPAKYLKFTHTLLLQLKEILPKNKLNEVLEKIAYTFSQEYVTQFDNLPLPQKLTLLKEILEKEGYMLEWEFEDDKKYVLRNINCPYYHIGLSHPEICKIDEIMFTNLLETKVHKLDCIAQGAKQCKFLIEDAQHAS